MTGWHLLIAFLLMIVGLYMAGRAEGEEMVFKAQMRVVEIME